MLKSVDNLTVEVSVEKPMNVSIFTSKFDISFNFWKGSFRPFYSMFKI